MELRIWAQVLNVELVGGARGDLQAAIVANAIDSATFARCGGRGRNPQIIHRIVDWWGDRKNAKREQTSHEKSVLMLAGLGVLDKVLSEKRGGDDGK